MNPQMAYVEYGSLTSTSQYIPRPVDMADMVSCTMRVSVDGADTLEFTTPQRIRVMSRVMVRPNHVTSAHTYEFVVTDVERQDFERGPLYTYRCTGSMWYDLMWSAVEAGSFDPSTDNATTCADLVMSRTPWTAAGFTMYDRGEAVAEWGDTSAWEALSTMLESYEDRVFVRPLITSDSAWSQSGKAAQLYSLDSYLASNAPPKVLVDMSDPMYTVTTRTGNTPELRRVYPLGKGGAKHTRTGADVDKPLGTVSYISNGNDTANNGRGTYRAPARSGPGLAVYPLDAFVNAPENLARFWTWSPSQALRNANPQVLYDIVLDNNEVVLLLDKMRVYDRDSGATTNVLVTTLAYDFVDLSVTATGGTVESNKAPAIATDGTTTAVIDAKNPARDAEATAYCDIEIPSTAHGANAQVSSSTTITGTVSLQGYTPVGIGGYQWRGGTRQNFFHFYRMDVGRSGTVTVSCTNYHSTDSASGTLRVFVVMARNDTLST